MSNITTKVEELSEKIRTLVTGQEDLRENVSKISKEAKEIQSELAEAKIRDGEAAKRLQSIEEKLDNLTRIVVEQQK